MNLSYGSSGSAVKQLQTALNSAGYGLAVDGIYGAKTQAAVRDYQSKNGLSVDGIAGANTQAKLYGTGSSSSSSSTSGSGASTETAAPAPIELPSYKYDASGDEAYQNALNALNTHTANGAPTYNATYDQQMADIYDKIMNREKFSYDLNEDALYNQYKDQYTQQGRMAMMDTMGQAAALTGGYSSSYGQAVGQQQYDAYLQSLNDIVPELYSAAYDRYNAEGDQMLQQYQLTGDLRDTEYNRYMDDYNKYMDTLANLQAQESEMYNRGYENWYNAQKTEYERQQDAYDKAVSLITTLGYIPSAEDLALAGMSDEEAQKWLKYYQAQQYTGGGSGGGGGGGSKYGSNTTTTTALHTPTPLPETPAANLNFSQLTTYINDATKAGLSYNTIIQEVSAARKAGSINAQQYDTLKTQAQMQLR